MELYCRSVDIFDKKILDDFAKEHIINKEYSLAGDCSLILNKGYIEIGDFYKWYKLVRRLAENKLKKNQVCCSCFLVLRKSDDYLIGIFDIRHSLLFKNGSIYGHIGVDIRPSERGKGYYKNILNMAIEKCRELLINPIVISCEYGNIVSYKGISHIFGNYDDMVLVDNTYFYVFRKYFDDTKERGRYF